MLKARRIFLMCVLISIFTASFINAQTLTINKQSYQKSIEQFGKYANAKTPSGKGMGFIPLNINFENSALINKVTQQYGAALPSSVDLSTRIPPVGDQGSVGSCVCWATGYYYKTYQEARERGWSVNDSKHQFSPSFLWNNHGGGQFFLSQEMIRGFGVPTVSSFPSIETATKPSHFTEAAQYKSANYTALFIKQTNIVGSMFVGKYGNNTKVLKSWLASGDVLVIGLPILNSFYDYISGVYNVKDPMTDAFSGLHALCVVGYDDSMKAFRAVNSWGSGWGENGYVWLGEDFVKNYVMEAWVMADQKADFQQDYDIVYKGSGAITVDTNGISITGGSLEDTIKISKKKSVLYGSPINIINTDGSFKKFYCDGQVGSLIVEKSLDDCTAQDVINYIYAGELGKIKMTGSANSTWDYYWDSLGRYNYTAITTIESSLYSLDKTKIDLVGVTLNGFNSLSPDVTIKVQTKKYQNKLKVDYLSMADVTGDIIAGKLTSLDVKGGSIDADSIISGDSIKTISAKAESVTLKFLHYMTAQMLYGGTVRAGLIQCGKDIGTISANHVSLRSGNYTYFSGGKITAPLTVTGLTEAGEAKPLADIKTINGSLGVNGKFMAGATISQDGKTFTPNFLGSVGSVQTSAPSPKLGTNPTITGEAWSKKTVKVKGGDASNFIIHTLK